VALNHWTGAAAEGLGWSCLWAAGISAFLAGVNFAHLGDVRFGVLWVLWTVLFALFCLVLALGRDQLARATGWVTVIEAFITATVPGALLLLGWWETCPTGSPSAQAPLRSSSSQRFSRLLSVSAAAPVC
jgi:putative amide transporter protein